LARIRDSSLTAEELMQRVQADLNRVSPTKFARFERAHGEPGRLSVGDEYCCGCRDRGTIPCAWWTSGLRDGGAAHDALAQARTESEFRVPRRFPIFQLPNAPGFTALIAGMVARATEGETARIAGVAAQVALLVASAEEVAGGANWFRRALGLAGGTLAVRRRRGGRHDAVVPV
jgi:hypothetical protein